MAPTSWVSSRGLEYRQILEEILASDDSKGECGSIQFICSPHADLPWLGQCALTCASSILGCIFPAQHVGTTGYKLARLFTVFCISGLAHAGGETMATRKAGFKSITFFMLQPFGIVIELVVSYLWHQLHRNGTKKFGPVLKKHDNDEEGPPPPWIRAIGTIWVMLWMVWTGAYMVDPLYSAFLKVKLYV